MIRKADKWFAVSVTVAPEYTEAAEFAFNNLDSLGSEIDLLSNKNSDYCTVTAYFSSRPDDIQIDKELKKAARIHGLPDVDFAVRRAVVHDRDWLAEWKKYWKPVEIGRFVIAAPWHDVSEKSDRLVIRIEPNMAFGTGTHETTQLCLAAIDEHYNAGQSFLDVGTGTGILAIAAAKISEGTGKITAVEVDPDAVEIARENADLNGLGSLIEFLTGSVDAAPGRFDLICANLTADVILPILPDLLGRTRSTLVLSGILAEQEKVLLGALPKDIGPVVSRSGEWIAIVVRK